MGLKRIQVDGWLRLTDRRVDGAVLVLGLRARVQSLALPHATSEQGVVTVSLGVALFDAQTMMEPKALVSAADAALYAAKHAGRNRTHAA